MSLAVHPGYYIREHVLPKGMSVTDAAKLLGVGRPALSNLLNGNASLSPNMAARMEKAFGADAHKLMGMQAIYDTALVKESGVAESSRPYVPVFLQFKALDLDAWADSISARHRLSVFLRTLVHSTGLQLTSVDIPGNDDSERPGWDGFVKANIATPWVPQGQSGWEFGVNGDPKQKADHDYGKSVEAVSPTERQDITFIFVTPRRWLGKNEWQSTHRAKKEWKDVLVYDASDLEQWLEQSVAGQAWFANERGVGAQGVFSLDACWKQWQADSEPTLIEALFDEALAHIKQPLITKLSNPGAGPLTIVADSREEALAFLYCFFSLDLAAMRDRVVVFTEPGALSRLISSSANFIPVATTRAVEKEFAPHRKEMPGIIIYPRNTAINVDADINLEPLSYAAFEKSLQHMGCSRDDVQQLSRESGRSLTILRRRLSKLPAIRTPEWARDTKYAADLVPFLLAGAWKTDDKATDDQTILSLLAHEVPYRELEANFATLLQLEDSPVWSVGTYHGLVSKMDALFAVSNSIQRADIDTFFQVAELVLSEDDPSLELPEKKRWMAALYDKVRDLSTALRDGICETLVLLSVYGPDLFKARLGVDTAVKARQLVHTLLTPLTVQTLEAHSNDLPMYAEASPEEFLEILETDLSMAVPASLKLMRPVSTGIFSKCYRSGLLWALEDIAWSPTHLVRAVSILARLAKYPINDNWGNKPITSLSAIFLFWMPQTAASVNKRIAAMKHLIRKHPQVAWEICVAQFNGHSTLGNYNHKPRWRSDARRYGEPVPASEAIQFREWAFETALHWERHSRQTLGDLVGCIHQLAPSHQLKIWDSIDQWSAEASDEDRAWLREKIRTNVKMAFTPQKEGPAMFEEKACAERARRTYELLKPGSLLMEHAWLFMKAWVEYAADERGPTRSDARGREERMESMRIEALQEIIDRYGIEGVLKLAEMGETALVIGMLLSQIVSGEKEQLSTLQNLIHLRSVPDSASRRSLISGFLDRIPENHFSRIIAEITVEKLPAEMISLLLLAPFQRRTWKFVDSLGEDIKSAYWKDVSPAWGPYSTEDMYLGEDLLLRAGRATAAFWFAGHRLQEVPPKMLFRMMKAIPSDTSGRAAAYPMQAYSVTEAFTLLNLSGEIPVDDMAVLEFQYLDELEQGEYGFPNLAKQIEDYPALFVEAITISYRREDGIDDSALPGASGTEERERRIKAAANLLEKVVRIPGHDKHGNIDAEKLRSWITSVREKCREMARSQVGDFRIGKVLSKAPVGKDGVWPCESVRDVLEDIANEMITRGVTNGLFNARGVHSRNPFAGGVPECELAAKYSAWADALDATHPNVAKILREMVSMYEHQAGWEDAEAGLRHRLGNLY